jgi:2-methylaconitate cis-trans-isomerase PrpF
MLRLRATWMRGGTSKCWLFDGEQLAAVGATPDRVLAAAFGAADPRQLDGVGGATSTTSKAAIVHRSTDPTLDVDYLFGQVGIGVDQVEWGSNCGNCATAIGLYALQSGLVMPDGDRTIVRMRNLNTGALLATTIATPGGIVPETGEATVPGVEGGGVPVELVFENPAGTSTGHLLPTLHAVDRLAGPNGEVIATLIDAGAPAALLNGAGMADGSLEDVAAHIPELTMLRRTAALAMGLAEPTDPVSYAIPKIGVLAAPTDYMTSDGRVIAGSDYDLAVRMVSMHAPHPAIGLTSAVAIAAAAQVPGSVVARLSTAEPGGPLRLGTLSGVVTVSPELDATGRLLSVAMARAARRIAVAEVFVPLDENADTARGTASLAS